MAEAHEPSAANEQSIGTPGACAKQRAPSEPSTDASKSTTPPRGTSVSPTLVPSMGLPLEDDDSHPRDLEARASNMISRAIAPAAGASASRPEVQLSAQRIPADATPAPQTAELLHYRLTRAILGDLKHAKSSGLVKAIAGAPRTASAFIVGCGERPVLRAARRRRVCVAPGHSGGSSCEPSGLLLQPPPRRHRSLPPLPHAWSERYMVPDS